MAIRNVMAVSLDGKIASYPGEPDGERHALGFTNADDRAHLLALLAETDAVIVGSQSLLASGGAFVERNDRGVYPVWAVMTQRGLPPAAGFYQQSDLPRWIVSPQPLPLPPHAGSIRQVTAGSDAPAASAAALVQALGEAGLRRVLLFGGSEINRIFYEWGLVDQLIMTLCPIILGSAAAVPVVAAPLGKPIKLSLVASQPKGNLVFLTYNVQKT